MYSRAMEPDSRSEQHASSEVEDPGPSRPQSHPSHRITANVTARSPQTGVSPVQPQPGAQSSASIFQLIGGLFRSGGAQQQADNGRHEASLKETVTALIEEHALEDGKPYLLPEEQNLLRNILRFGEMSVSDIMIPRTDITAVPYDVSLEELKRVVVEERHSRIPVYKENLDQMAGFLHIKDIAVNDFAGRPFVMEDMMRQLLFVPPSMKVLDLLLKMRVSSVHIAIVVDEYGGTDGLVSMEDIVEEIVGEIQDEHDDESEAEAYVWLDERTIEADARMEIEELDTCFGGDVVLHEDEEEFDTVGGLVFSHLGHIPETGEQFDYPTGLRITILEAEPRAVKRVRIERLDHAPQNARLSASVK